MLVASEGRWQRGVAMDVGTGARESNRQGRGFEERETLFFVTYETQFFLLQIFRFFFYFLFFW